ncbi:MAG TPA: hypothetical protein VK157_11635 [Phycisphaerales bacterium]|nr:hypothetical protein [Phycisphaerales bacterium]
MRSRFAVSCLLMCSASALAQPTDFYDFGLLDPVTAPPYASAAVDLSEMFDFDSQIPLTVQWARFTLAGPISGDTFLDTGLFISLPAEPVLVALYNSTGNLVAFDESQGGFLGAGGLSFGSSSERVPFTVAGHAGQDGTLAAGTYWLAFVAGPAGTAATINPTNWDVTTTASTVLGFDENENYIAPVIYLGNTTPVAAPANDNCANAIPVFEDIGAAPAWQGSNFGATQDGVASCYSNLQGVTTKDIWFSYIPSQTGFAQIVAATTGDDANDAVISLFPAGCGTIASRCVGGGNFVIAGGSRLAFPVTAGQPVLFSLAQRGGFFGGSMRLNIDLLPAPCDIQTPASAIPEAELCGSADNNGCFLTPPAFGAVAPGDVISGTLFTTATTRDTDWYSFTLTQAAIAQVTARGEAALTAVIQRTEEIPGACFGQNATFATQSDALNPCTPLTLAAPLAPGTYRVAIAHNFLDEMSCDSGYTDYWFSLETLPCDQPAIIAQPDDQTACVGGTVVYSAAFTSPQPISRVWQVGIDAGFPFPAGTIAWSDLYDGTLDAASSFAQVTGSDTDTLTISNIDEAAATALFFRAIATTCAGQISRSASFTLLPAGGCEPFCDSIDFNQNGVFPEDQDVIDFFNVLAGADCPQCNDIDFNNNGVFPEDQDVIDFFNVLAGGDC